MDKFTPGPWQVRDEKLRPQFSATILQVDGVDGLPVVAWPGFDGVNRPKREKKANACLIAAAPAMYESLRRYVEVYKDHPERLGTKTAAMQHFIECRTLLTKIDGETNG